MCQSHDDCDEGMNGRCTLGRFPHCTYDECFTDDDCEGTVCLCGGAAMSDANRCIPQGNCRTDADCGAGGFCSPTLGDCGNYGGVVGFFCRTPEDECLNDDECVNPDERGGRRAGQCRFNLAGGRWMCGYSECVG